MKRRDKASFGQLVYAERGDAMLSGHCPIAVTIEARWPEGHALRRDG